MKLYTRDQIQHIERYCTLSLNISEAQLMRKAAISAFNLIRHQFPDAHKLLVCCGSGHNAGDGYALAHMAKLMGYEVAIIATRALESLPDTSREMASLARSESIDIQLLHHLQWDQYDSSWDLIIDAIYGTGLNRTIEEPVLTLIQRLNQSDCPILSLDIPSGCQCDTGHVFNVAIQAHTTLTFVGRKIGLYTGQGVDQTGQLFVSDLDIPDIAFKQVEREHKILDLDAQLQQIPNRPQNSHKHQFGRLLVVGGDHNMMGAAILCASAAARVGTGLIRVATRARHCNHIVAHHPELMAYSTRQLSDLLHRSDVIAIGPGLGEFSWGEKQWRHIKDTPQAKVVDASALYWLAQDPCYRDNWILTPHPGEAAKLLDVGTQDIQADRKGAIEALQNKYGGVIVLKGAGTLVYDGNHLHLCDQGNPGMASAGMGDVLTGVIAGLMAQGLSATDAAQMGVALHANAGDHVAQAQGQRGIQASDLMAKIQQTLN